MENIKDGTAEFRVTDDRLFSILDLIYPVGRIIISNDSTAPYSDIGFGTWQEVAKGAFIEGADDSHKAGDNIDAGLPNITGTVNFRTISISDNNLILDNENGPTGAFYETKKVWSGTHSAVHLVSYSPYNIEQLNISAGRSNTTYGKSNTVQPKAYVSHYWLRVK